MNCKTLGDLGTIITGKTPPTKEVSYWDGNIPFITPKDIQITKHVFSTERCISSEGLEKVRGAKLPAGAICVSCIGNIGYVGVTTETSVSNQQINSIVVNDDNDSEFVFYLLKNLWIYFKNYEGQSTTLSILNKTHFSEIEVNVPEKSVQKKIATILSCIDNKIELNQKINENLERQVAAVFDMWFVDPIATDSKLPVDWIEGTLGDVANIASGKRPPMRQASPDPGVTIPLVGAASIMGYTNQALYSEPILVTGRVGTHGIVQRFQTPCWASDNTLVIKSPYYEFVYQILQRIDYKNMNRGSTQPLITQTDLKNSHIVLPTVEWLQKFETLAGGLMAKYETNRIENGCLAKLRDTLLPKLMSGEIDLSNIQL